MKIIKHLFFAATVVFLAACSEEKSPLPAPIAFTPVTGAAAERIQLVLDAALDNYFTNIEKETGIQGKISLIETSVKTTNQRPDRVIRFEHPKLCHNNTCPFILLTQNNTYTNEQDRWNLEFMMNGTTFAVGEQLNDGRYDLFIVNNTPFPRHTYDGQNFEGPIYELDVNFRLPHE